LYVAIYVIPSLLIAPVVTCLARYDFTVADAHRLTTLPEGYTNNILAPKFPNRTRHTRTLEREHSGGVPTSNNDSLTSKMGVFVPTAGSPLGDKCLSARLFAEIPPVTSFIFLLNSRFIPCSTASSTVSTVILGVYAGWVPSWKISVRTSREYHLFFDVSLNWLVLRILFSGVSPTK
jgi:hypothetical protein